MKTIPNTEAWAELTSAQNAVTETSAQLFQFYSRTCEDNSAEGAMLGDAVNEIRQQLEDVKRRLRMLANYYTN